MTCKDFQLIARVIAETPLASARADLAARFTAALHAPLETLFDSAVLPSTLDRTGSRRSVGGSHCPPQEIESLNISPRRFRRRRGASDA
jgi:hypothetical protein